MPKKKVENPCSTVLKYVNKVNAILRNNSHVIFHIIWRNSDDSDEIILQSVSRI